MSWAADYLAAPTPSAVETGYGWLRGSVWNPSPTFKLKIFTGKAKGSWLPQKDLWCPAINLPQCLLAEVQIPLSSLGPRSPTGTLTGTLSTLSASESGPFSRLMCLLGEVSGIEA